MNTLELKMNRIECFWDKVIYPEKQKLDEVFTRLMSNLADRCGSCGNTGKDRNDQSFINEHGECLNCDHVRGEQYD